MAQLPIDRLLQNSDFGPEQAIVLGLAYHEIIAALANPLKPKVPAYLAEVIARKVIAIGHAEEREYARIVARVFEEIGIQKPRAARPR